MTIRKSYERSDLLISDRELEHRIRLIENVTSTTAYQTKFEITHEGVTRIIPKGPRARLSAEIVSISALKEVAKTLDCALRLGLVHGDIHWKNIIDARQPTLVDWEPSLFQIRAQHPTLMVTHPWIDLADRATNCVSMRTDLICFSRLLTNFERKYFQSQIWYSILADALRSRRPFWKILRYFESSRSTSNDR